MNSETKLYLRRSSMLLYMLIICILFFLQTFITLQRPNATEPRPPIIYNIPDDKLPFGNGVTIVKSGLFIKNFLEFDEKNGLFELDGIVWFSFNPTIISLDDIEHFSIANGSIVNRTLLNTRLLGDQLLATYDVRLSFYALLNHRYFPLSDHRIYIILKNDRFTPDEIHFQVDRRAIGMVSDLQTFGWQLLEFEVFTGYFSNQLDAGVQKKLISYPSIIFAFSFDKSGIGAVLVVLAPTFLLFLFGLLSLLIEGPPALQFSTSIASLSGLLVYRFVIESIIPKVGYFTLTDYLYLIFMTSTFLVLVINVYGLKKPLSNELKAGFYYGLQAFALIAYYYLTEF